MKHIIVFLAYSELDIIKTSFDSILSPEFDYFIVENGSKNSESIANYFKDLHKTNSNIKGYIQYTDNLAASALDYFLEDFHGVLSEYDFITITDGDFYVHDVIDMMCEVRSAFTYTDCCVSSVKLYMGNDYSRPMNGFERVIGTDIYDEIQKGRMHQTYNPQPGFTSNCFITFQPAFLDELKKIHYIDTSIYNITVGLCKRWYVTEKHDAYHLTWDLYTDGHPYYEWKKDVINHIWDIKPRVEYKKII